MIKKAALFVVTVLISVIFAEAFICMKNSNMKDYDIEMWKYSKKLKKLSLNPNIGHEHIPSTSAMLQSVNIRLNEYGLRGAPIKQYTTKVRRILFLGNSVTLGWGVDEEHVLTTLIEKMFKKDGEDVEVLNAGVGNYNAARYVELFMTKLTDLRPTDIVVHYHIRDAEKMTQTSGNWFMRNSQLAVTLWRVSDRFIEASGESLEKKYANIYKEDSEGFLLMETALKRLSIYAKENNIRLYLVMQPELHDLRDYKYTYVHSTMKKMADKYSYKFIDLLEGFKGMDQKDIWVMPTDPHPNALGHKIMADLIYSKIR